MLSKELDDLSSLLGKNDCCFAFNHEEIPQPTFCIKLIIVTYYIRTSETKNCRITLTSAYLLARYDKIFGCEPKKLYVIAVALLKQI